MEFIARKNSLIYNKKTYGSIKINKKRSFKFALAEEGPTGYSKYLYRFDSRVLAYCKEEAGDLWVIGYSIYY
jgi:hypothetical protein